VIRVRFYSGHRGEETPLSFEADGQVHLIDEVIERAIVEDFHTRRRQRVFLVRTDRNEHYELRGDEKWSLRQLPDSHFA